MSFGFGFGLPSWKTLSGGFTPASLFTGGQQGVWFDPSDYSTLFQDAAGTTPVTAVEQAVRLMLDKSKGLVLGAELITPAANRDFSSDTGYWNRSPATGTITITGGQCVFTAVPVGYGIFRSSLVQARTYYEVTFTLASVTAGGIRIYLGGNYGATVTAAGVYTQRICSGSADTMLYFETASATTTLALDDVSLKVVTGNHATAPSDPARPILRARYNLLTYSEQFDNAYWLTSNATISANTSGTTDPLGGNTADKLQETAANNFHYVAPAANPSVVSGSSYTWSIYAKKAERSWLCIDAFSGTSANCWFDLNNGVTGVTAAGATSTITAVGNGWYRCTVTRNTAAATAGLTVVTSNADGVGSYQGVAGNGIYIWGAQLLTAADQTATGGAYQRIAAATNYDTSNPVFRPYLAANGTSTSMSTGSIDFTAGDKMSVFAGVTKLSDAAGAVVVELSTNWISNNGAFVFTAPDSAGTAQYGIALTGNNNAYASAATYAAPITNVVTELYDIGASVTTDEIKMRINGGNISLSGVTGPAGTGNFGNYPLYLFARNNASLWFNGRYYGGIVVGAQLTAAQISSTEAWINQKTGAY